MPKYDWIIVGAGFAGSVLAERLAKILNNRVLLIDRRAHIGGNAYDEFDENGILVHKYGPHIFHTNSERIFDYLSQFTEWRPYEHRVLAQLKDITVPIPINRTTLNKLYDLDLNTDEQARLYLKNKAVDVKNVTNAEEAVISQVGWDLYETFFKGYTLKQWGVEPSSLDKSVTSRIPTRFDTDDRYFTDRYQFMPLNGYTEMFRRMLDHPNIDIELSVSWSEYSASVPASKVIFTGCIDEYFDYCFGKLPYRSLRFEHKHIPHIDFQQECGTVNYPSAEVPFTRITEFKHLTGQIQPGTSVVHEFPEKTGEPFYPIPNQKNSELYKLYEDKARSLPNVYFVGRLANYKYYNMDQIVGQALSVFERIARSV